MIEVVTFSLANGNREVVLVEDWQVSNQSFGILDCDQTYCLFARVEFKDDFNDYLKTYFIGFNNSLDEIKNNFGKRVADIVSALSQDNRLPKKERELEYIKRVHNADINAQMVKISDMIHNIKSSKTETSKKFHKWLVNWYKSFKFSGDIVKEPIFAELKNLLKE